MITQPEVGEPPQDPRDKKTRFNILTLISIHLVKRAEELNNENTFFSHFRLGKEKERVPTSEYNQVPTSDDDLTSTKNRN